MKVHPIPPAAPRLVDCATCAGRGATRLVLVSPAGKRSRERGSVCPDCHGTGAHISSRRSA